MESDIGIQILGLFSVINQSHKNDLNLLPLEDLPSCPKNTQLVYLIMKTIINWSLSKIDIFPFFFFKIGYSNIGIELLYTNI